VCFSVYLNLYLDLSFLFSVSKVDSQILNRHDNLF